MLKVAHPWIKNRNIVEGETIFSFDSKGVALVKDLGNARVDLERLLKKPTGKFFIPEEKATEVPAAPAPEVLTSASVVLESEEPEDEMEPEEEVTEEKATKRTPAKKRTGGKKE